MKLLPDHFGTIYVEMAKMVNLSGLDHLGPFWAHMDHFGTFQTKMIILPQMDWRRCFRANKTKWPRQVRELILDSDSEILDFGLSTRKKMAIYCPQGSGTLRQQLLMMH